MSDWCILRTNGRNTLGLASSLRDDGFDAWTPVEKVRVAKKRGKLEVPFMPTWVFARTAHLLDLIELAEIPRKRQPSFSVFHFRDLVPLVMDAALDPLRNHERASGERYRIEQRKALEPKFARGLSVKIEEGAFAGWSGVVERPGKKYSIVLFPDCEMEVANWWLHPVQEAA